MTAEDMVTGAASGAGSTLLSGVNHDGKSQSTTHAAVSDGSIIIRDKDKQTQDIATLNRDTVNDHRKLIYF